MRKVWVLASAVLAFLNFVKSQEVARTLYSARYDNLDIDTILGSNRLVSNYVDCLLSRKPCPPEGKDLKRILPEALRTKCTRCSPIQKENALKIITRLYFDYPDQYRALRERWDPSGEYHRRFEEYLRGLQFNQIGGSVGGNGAGGGAAQAPPPGDNGIGTVPIGGGGNDRPVRNDLDRQPATQSSNVQAVVIDPALLPGGSVNTLLASPPTPPPPATERPRPPAPVAQILFPTTSVTSDTSPIATTTSPPTGVSTTTTSPNTTTTTTTTTTSTSTTSTTTSTSTSGPVELTGGTAGVPAPSNTATTSTSSTTTSLSGGSGDVSNGAVTSPSAPRAPAGQDSVGAAPAPPVVVVNRFGDDGASDRPPVPITSTTPRTTTTVRQTRPVTRQTTTRSVQRTTTRFITRAPQTLPPTIPPRTRTTTQTTMTTTRTTTSTILPPRPPPPPPTRPPQQVPAQQQPLLPQAPSLSPPAYPTILYERPQAPPPRATAPPQPPARPFYVPDAPPAPPPTPYGTTPDSIIDHFFVPPSQAANPPLPQPPLVGLWNQLGTKIADTADAIAGMLQKTVDVLVTSHIQSHQRALRRT